MSKTFLQPQAVNDCSAHKSVFIFNTLWQYIPIRFFPLQLDFQLSRHIFQTIKPMDKFFSGWESTQKEINRRKKTNRLQKGFKG